MPGRNRPEVFKNHCAQREISGKYLEGIFSVGRTHINVMP